MLNSLANFVQLIFCSEGQFFNRSSSPSELQSRNQKDWVELVKLTDEDFEKVSQLLERAREDLPGGATGAGSEIQSVDGPPARCARTTPTMD